MRGDFTVSSRTWRKFNILDKNSQSTYTRIIYLIGPVSRYTFVFKTS
jgi:hypothetical protein